MKFVEMFAGIGGMSYGLQSAGMECIGFAEWDKFAHKAYNILHNADGRKEAWTDVTRVSDDDLRLFRERSGNIDLLAAGFPCQAFSIAGKRLGFEDTRGTLFFEVARWVSILKPKYVLFENVKGLVNHAGGATFRTILSIIDELGYDCQWQVLNSKDYVPQNRERIFIVGHLRTECRPKVFPITGKNSDSISNIGLLDIKGDESIRRVYATDGISPALTTMQGGNREPKIMVVGNTKPIDATRQGTRDFVYDEKGIIGCLTATDYKQPKQVLVRVKEATKLGYAEATEGDSINFSHPKSATPRGRVGKGVANTLETNISQGVIVPLNTSKEDGSQFYHQDRVFDSNGIMPALTSIVQNVKQGYSVRKLTPLECFRLQSFPDEWYHTLVEHGFSNSQLYKMAGNAVTSKVAEAIGRRLLNVE